MTAKAKIAVAAGGSAVVHLLLLGGAVGWIAVSGIPGNDDFSLRTKLGNASDVRASGSNFAASREQGEPAHGDAAAVQSGSVWWSWQAPEEASNVLIEIDLQGADCLAGIYRGFAVDQLETVTSSTSGTLTFAAEPGCDYHLAVAGRGRDGEGLIELRIQAFTDEDERIPEPQETALLLPEIRIEQKPDEQEKPQLVRTEPDQEVREAAEEAGFESDHNTRAASELPPEEGGAADLPSMDGVDLPTLELVQLRHQQGPVPADDVAAARAKLVAGEAATAPAADAPLAVAEGGREVAQLEMASAIPVTEAALPDPETPAAEAAFQPHTLRQKVSGTIAEPGSAAVDAAETPRGRYYRQVVSAVEKRWHQQRPGTQPGSLKIKAIIRPSGQAESPRIIEQDAGKFLIDHAIDSILKAEIPPIPDEVLRGLGGQAYEITFNFITN